MKGLLETAVDPETRQPISDDVKKLINKRELKVIQKYIKINTLDPISFDRTVEEVKFRYYEVARAILKYRNQKNHRYFKYPVFDIEQEIYRKNNWEKVFARVKEQFEKERALL